MIGGINFKLELNLKCIYVQRLPPPSVPCFGILPTWMTYLGEYSINEVSSNQPKNFEQNPAYKGTNFTNLASLMNC